MLYTTPSTSWETFVNEFRGPSYLSPELDNVDHPAATLLRMWRDEGVPAETSIPEWTLEQKDSCVECGCHQSANEHSGFLREELADFIEDKFWLVLQNLPNSSCRRLLPRRNANGNHASCATTVGTGVGPP